MAGAKQGNLRVVQNLPPPPSNEDGSPQQIAANDVLEVDVFQVDELDRTVQVDTSGDISLPLIGQVRAAGNSVRALERQIEDLYGAKYLQNPEVSVFVKESFYQRATVDGEVNKAGIYPVTANSSLIGLISQAGGLKDIADRSKVYVFRDHGEEKLVANFSVKKIRSGKMQDPRIFGGDVIVVFSSSSRVAMNNLRDVLGLAGRAALFVP
ncbi:polysaccharide biosynthesis/export family protein [Hoeflea sp. TYP-13]|uniref:polysaccharide biosynthesis/export family protein n=1 Tax=Hoeflea sp. TYP-13 TaxID=3230023 RepID=UPI0034C61A07